MERREVAVGAFEPTSNGKFPGNFPFGRGSNAQNTKSWLSKPWISRSDPHQIRNSQGISRLISEKKFEKKFRSAGSTTPSKWGNLENARLGSHSSVKTDARFGHFSLHNNAKKNSPGPSRPIWGGF